MDKVNFIFSGTHYHEGIRYDSGSVLELSKEEADSLEAMNWGKVDKPKAKKRLKNESSSN